MSSRKSTKEASAHIVKLRICIKKQDSQPDSKICSIMSHEHSYLYFMSLNLL